MQVLLDHALRQLEWASLLCTYDRDSWQTRVVRLRPDTVLAAIRSAVRWIEEEGTRPSLEVDHHSLMALTQHTIYVNEVLLNLAVHEISARLLLRKPEARLSIKVEYDKGKLILRMARLGLSLVDRDGENEAHFSAAMPFAAILRLLRRLGGNVTTVATTDETEIALEFPTERGYSR
jgi:hypothetical protein